MKEGIKEGKRVGEQKTKMEIIKNMIKHGMKIEDISNIVEINKNEIEKFIEIY